MGVLRRLVVAGCAATALLLGGCQPDEVDPQVPTSESQVPTSVNEEQMYQDAFETFTKYFEVMYRYEQQGGFESVPDDLKQYVMGPELAGYHDTFIYVWELGLRYSGTNVNQIEKWQPVADPGPGSPAFMAIEVCRYHERTDLLNADGTIRVPGGVFKAVAYAQFARDTDGIIKIYYTESEMVESCPF